MKPPRSETISSPAVLKFSGRFFFHSTSVPQRTASFTCIELMAVPGDSRDISCSDMRDILVMSISPYSPPSSNVNELSASICIRPRNFCAGGL